MDERSTILLVDDDDAVRVAVGALLEEEGFSVLCAENGREALDLLERGESPSLILLDLVMPVVDGWQFLAERGRTGSSGARSAPVVLLSGLGFIRGAAGIADFLRKPIDSGALLACVRRFCRASSPRPARFGAGVED